MKEKNNIWKQFVAAFLIAILAVGFLQFVGTETVSANNTPQTLPFSQNWTNVGLITVDDDWSAVPGIIGYRGDDLSTVIGADLQTVVANGSATPVDVNANRSDPDVFATGGVTEFDGIPNPVVAFQGSATSDVPHIVIHLNTTGRSNIQVAYNARDIDNGTGADSIQQINTQFRVGGTGDYQNVTGGYIADASAAGGATLVTPVNVTLPASANNQSLVEVRIMTINAIGTDEFIGIDDINITGTGGPVVTVDAPVDFNGDGKTDWSVVRNVGGGANGQLRWFYNTNGTGAATVALDWGLNSDVLVPADYDGDQKDDVAVWRPGAALTAAFYILNSATMTARVEQFGQTGDNPTVVNDYNGDGKDDVAVYRAGAQSVWYYRTVAGGAVTFINWGTTGDFVAPGDYNGDGTADFGVQRNAGGAGQFWIRLSNGTFQPVTTFGLSTDFVITGDFDGDAKTDLAVRRSSNATWYWRPSGGGADQQVTFGLSTDALAPGDYDGDGKTDVAVWRNGVFYARSTTSGAVSFFTLGLSGDLVPAAYNVH